MIELTKAQMERAFKAFGYGNGWEVERATIEKPKGGWLRLFMRNKATGLHEEYTHYLARHSIVDVAITDFILQGKEVRANG